MKTTISLIRKSPLFFISLLFSALVITSCHKDNDNDNNNRMYTVSGSANGSQMVPTVSGSGTGTISGTYDPNSRTLTYTSNWNGLTGMPTSAGFYTGATGVNGVAVGTPFTISSSATGTGTTSGTMVLTTEQASQLTSGNWYYTYRTSANPNGEVRGQIMATR